MILKEDETFKKYFLNRKAIHAIFNLLVILYFVFF